MRAQVAQLVEHSTENAGVGCSIQPLGTTPFLWVPLPFSLILIQIVAAIDDDALARNKITIT